MTPEDLTKVPYATLVEEIRRRSTVAIVAAILKDAHPEANIRVSMHVQKGTRDIELAGLASLMQEDVIAAVRDKMMGNQTEG